MKHEIRVPAVSEGVTEGTVVNVSVAVGDSVEVEQTLLELETDKAVVEVPSSHAGKITEVLVSEGDRVAIDALIMVLESSGGGEEAVAPEVASEDNPAPDVEEEPVPTAVAEPIAPAEDVTSSAPQRDEPKVDLNTVRRNDLVAPAAPSVRRLARDLGVDIYQVQGTGPGGRISEDDVRNFVRETMQRITGGGPVPSVVGEFPGLHAQRPLPDFSRWGTIRRESLSRVRELTADSMGYAWSTIPMVTQYDNAQITEVEAFRQKTNQRASTENRLTMTAIMVKVCATALKAFPGLNSSLDLANKELVLKDYVHIGVAVDTPGGLLVPVIRDADQKGIERLATELNGLAEKTRERKVSPADMEGGTFTISNLGGIGGSSFTPIVYAPQVAILGVSTASMQPVWDGNQFVPQLVMPLSLTYDHRVVDGADGARFLRWICEALENPLNLVMKG